MKKKSKKSASKAKAVRKEIVNSTGVTPLADRVLVKPVTQEEKSVGGIIIPETVSKEKPMQGKVIAVGQGKYDEDGENLIPMQVKVGDTVLFSKYGYDDVKIKDEEYYIIKEENILAVIK